MSIFKKIFYYYTAIIITIMLIGGFYISKMTWLLLIQNILLLPIVFLLWFSIFKKLPKSKFVFIVLVYSAIFSLIITIGGLITMRKTTEIISNILFLPVTIEILAMLIKQIKDKKHLSADRQENNFHRI